jgi:hypothetical protein
MMCVCAHPQGEHLNGDGPCQVAGCLCRQYERAAMSEMLGHEARGMTRRMV